MQVQKKQLVITVGLLLSLVARSQSAATRQSQWIDSLAQKEARGIQQQFHLSAGQVEALHQAYLQAYAARKKVIAGYWKTDSFPIMIARADRFKDSLYVAILGQRQFHDYQDSLYRRRERMTGKTSLSLKPTQP